jgi:uncharacterized membrane protein (UPF0136 family)
VETAAAPRPRAPVLQHALAALAYLVVSLVYLRPIWQVFGDHIPSDPGDSWFNLTMLKWGMHQVRLGMPDFWNLPFFFPSRGVTAWSDNLLGPAAIGSLLTTLLPGMTAVAVYNLFYLSSFVLCAWGTWFVLRRSGAGAVAAFFGGCVFAFSSFRWSQAPHIQVLLMGWIPLTLWTWDRLLEKPAGKRAFLFFLCFVLHVTGGSYLAYMILFPMMILLAIRAPGLVGRERWRSALKILAPTGIACVVVLGVLFLPYSRGSGSRARSRLEIQQSGASLASYLTPASNLWWAASVQPWQRNENALFAGLLPTFLITSAGLRGWRTRRQVPVRPLSRGRIALLAGLTALALAGFVRGEIATWSIFKVEDLPAEGFDYRLAATGLLLGVAALGLRRLWGGNWPLRPTDLPPWERGLLFSGVVCFLLTFPIVYQPLMQWIPGLSGMRVSARFYSFVSFAIAWFAARELDLRLRGTGAPVLRRTASVLLLLVLLAELTPSRLEWVPTPPEGDYPPVYHWLARQQNIEAVLELPMVDFNAEISYMLMATRHWKPLLNGFSGYFPDPYLRFREGCCWPVPNPRQLAVLRDWGVTHILLHRRALDQDWSWQALATFEKGENVKLEYDDGEDRVYRIQ